MKIWTSVSVATIHQRDRTNNVKCVFKHFVGFLKMIADNLFHKYVHYIK